MRFHRTTEGEFTRLIETKTILKLIAQESEVVPDKFCLVGINPHERIGYAIRHGRVDDLRTWRLDNLVKFLKKQSQIIPLEVQYK
ncbi:hypothetical protein HWV00_21170 (plasmid) [Moritella sp. 24]|uniref:hypothetical protein n=1 Tax=Moritella sp. 24 TaxID=2746230 RepID=UPI001BA85190|nr:hypothetical protein [Moritella sp. 24]QUM78787.1 hypothetical protein HWV00_21170 [Moritella sp. 24]